MSASSDRYTSATNIADFAIARGWLASSTTGIANKLPDALTAGSALGRLGGPILYTPASPLASQTQAWLSAKRPKLVLGAGGTISLAQSTLDMVGQLLQ